MNISRLNFSTKLAALFLLLSLVPLTLVGVIAYQTSQRQISAHIFHYLTMTAILKNAALTQWFTDKQHSVEELAQRPLVRQYAATLAKFTPTDPIYASSIFLLRKDHLDPILSLESWRTLFLIDAKTGEMLLSTSDSETLPRYDVLFALSCQERTRLAPPYYSETLQRPIITIATPVKHADGTTSTILAGEVDMKAIQQILAQGQEMRQTEETYLVNRERLLISESRFLETPHAGKALDSEGIKACLSGKNGNGFYADYRHVAVVGTYRWIEALQTCLLIEIDHVEAFASIVTLRRNIIEIGLGIAAIAATVAVLIARRVAIPLIRLIEGIKQIGRGNLDTRLEESRQPEIRRISQAFNDMVQQLKIVTASRDALNREVAERIRTESLLHRSEERFKSQYQSIPIPTFTWKKSGDDFVLIDFNRAAENLTNGRAAFMLGKFANEVYRDRPDILEDMRRCGIEQDIIRREFPYQSGQFQIDGYFAFTLAPVPSDLIMLHTEDITERKQAEGEIRSAREAAEMANRAKTEFLATISHELRTPLNAILGYTQLLKNEEGQTELMQHGIQTIHASGEHLLLIINDLLDLSRIEAGKMSMVRNEVHLRGFLKGIEDIIFLRAREKGLKFVREFAPDLPTAVYVDEQRLRQILLNLLGNAVKFTKQGDVIFRVKCNMSVEMANDLSPKACEYRQLRFEVEDTGVGIPSSHLRHIFEPFHQVDSYLKHVAGTGLGLTISQRLAGMMDTKIEVLSEQHHGSLFWFDLALPEVLPPLPQTFANIPRGGQPTEQPHKILVVDDDETNRLLLVNMLKPLGFQVFEAGDGHEAIHVVEAKQPEMILLDLLMPIMDGFEAIQQIRALPGQEHVMIIALSADAYEEARQKSLEAGCLAFLAKPFKLEELLATIRRLFQQREEQRSPAIAAENAIASPAEIFLPPAEILLELLQFAQIGDIFALRSRLQELQQSDARTAQFFTTLRSLAKNADIGKIQTVLTEALLQSSSASE